MTKLVDVPTGLHNIENLKLSMSSSLSPELATKLTKSLNSVNGLVHSLEHLISRPDNSGASWFSTFLYGDVPSEKMRTGTCTFKASRLN